MACQDNEPGQKCKQRFKGIENFLRKVAYNLGNSPSQTEVKIISCIPIDVTDLQQKIIHLERQLELATAGKPKVTLVNTAQCCGPPGGFTPPAACCDPLCADAGSRKSVVSFVCPDVDEQGCGCGSQFGDPIPQCCSITPPKRKLFKKKPKKNCSPLVYYAQMTSSPFATCKKLSAKKEMQNADARRSINRPYVSTEIIRKQYRAERYLEEGTGSSQLSAPVCRDARAAAAATAPASDVCSCCRGRFHDLDQDFRSYPFLNPTSIHTMPQNIDHSIYYDSSYYDLVPVKEKPDRLKKETERPMKRETRVQLDAMCWQKSYRPYPDRNPLIMNCILPPPTRCMRRAHLKYSKKRDRPTPRAWCNDISRNALVECGDTYIKKPVTKKCRPQAVVLKNAECITLNVNDSECQTETSKSVQQPETTNVPVENKTEVTLNQIKTILQSVLTQVKTNNQAKNQTEEKDTKDAIVQQETQDSSQDRSRILSSFTYSPFAINSYMAPCSRTEPSGPCRLPMMQQSLSMPPQCTSLPISHIQNYPLFIHRTPAKQQQCLSCYHPGHLSNKSAQPKQTSTSELPRAEIRNKETESLIKEIYKSVALNMNVPTNDTSRSDYDNHKPPEGTRNESGEPVVSNVVTLSRQVGSSAQKFHTHIRQTTLSTANVNKVMSRSDTGINKPSGDQRPEGHHDTKSLRKRKVHESKGLESDTPTTSQGHTLKPSAVEETLSEEDVESGSESETDSDQTTATVKKTAKETGKKGLLSKMFGSVFKKRRRKEKEDEYATSVAADDSEASESDDYQTVYSQTVEKPSKHVRYAPTQHKSKETKSHDDHQKRSYVDHQNRRCWDDQLPQYQQPEPKPRAMTRRTRPPGIYFQNFEMRPALLNTSQPDYSRQGAHYMRNAPQNDTFAFRPRRNVGLKFTKKANWMKKQDSGYSRGPRWKELDS